MLPYTIIHSSYLVTKEDFNQCFIFVLVDPNFPLVEYTFLSNNRILLGDCKRTCISKWVCTLWVGMNYNQVVFCALRQWVLVDLN